ncbi:hypothetical protein D9M69_558750 [compost metagenome]
MVHEHHGALRGRLAFPQVVGHGQPVALREEHVDHGGVPGVGVGVEPVDGFVAAAGGGDDFASGEFPQSIGQGGGNQGVVFYEVDAGHRCVAWK